MVDKIFSALLARAPQTLDAPGSKQAAVLVPIQDRSDGAHLVLTQRAEMLNSHAGQIAFPGGRIEPLDASPLAAALRESHEEIGLDPAAVRVLGQLDQVTASSDYLITPFIGVVPDPYDFRLNPAEAAAVFSVPVAGLLEEGCLKIEPRPHRSGRRDPVYHFYYQDRDIWGATARIILQVLELAYGFRPDK